MSILDKIIEDKRTEIRLTKEKKPINVLKESIFYKRSVRSLKQALLVSDTGIIAEFKRRSPSRGTINGNSDVVEVTKGYFEAGAAAVSILTDNKYFGGTSDDLLAARDIINCPILRKDFIIDEYQIVEAKSIGADAILLIAAVLSKEQITEYTDFAHFLGLEVLTEIHSMEELEKLNNSIDILGINNRDLKKFHVDVHISIELNKHIPTQFIRISESGISDPGTIVKLRNIGFRGFLIGETFMKMKNPDYACRQFIHEVESQLNVYKNE